MDNWLAQYIDPYYMQLLVLMGINLILALGLNIITGMTGQLSMGHAGFMSIGAYTSAMLSIAFNVPFGLSLLAGGLMAAFFGLIIGIPTLRLEGDYLAMVTIGFAEIVRVFFLNFKPVGGGMGLSGIPMKTDLVVVWGIALIVLFFCYRLTRSRKGRAFYAIREDEIAAEASGVPTTVYKVEAFVLGSFLGGLGGGLYAHYMTYISPQDFGFMKSVELLNMVVLGGMGSIPGVALGTFILTLAPEALRFVQEYRLLFYGALLVILMIFRPSGILGDIRLYDIKQRFRSRFPQKESIV